MCLLTLLEEWIRGESLTEEHWSSQMSQALRTASNGPPGTLSSLFTLFHSLSALLDIYSQALSVSSPLVFCFFEYLLFHSQTTKVVELGRYGLSTIKASTRSFWILLHCFLAQFFSASCRRVHWGQWVSAWKYHFYSLLVHRKIDR